MEESAEHERIARLGARAVAKALACFWGAFVTLNTIRHLALGYPHPLASFERRIGVAIFGVALSWAMYRLLVRFRPSTLRASILLTSAMSLPAALIFSTINFLVFDMLTPIPGEECRNGLPCTMHDLVVGVSEMLINWTFVFVAWGMLYLSLESAAEAGAANLRSAAHREAARLAQIRALRYQVNPHFLFNVLNSLTALVSRRETAEAEMLIGEIGGFLRYGLAADPVADAILSDEVEMQKRYLELERRRFPERLSVLIDIAPEAASASVPPLILQPLIENAVKHGVGRTSLPVTIAVRAMRLPDGRLRISVEDDAPPTDDADADEAGADDAGPGGEVGRLPDGFGLGLQNVADRLAARYGPAAAFAAGPLPNGGYRAELTIPLLKG